MLRTASSSSTYISTIWASPLRRSGYFPLNARRVFPRSRWDGRDTAQRPAIFSGRADIMCRCLRRAKVPAIAQVGLNVARTLEKRLKDDGEPLWGLKALPEKDRIPGSVQYFAKDAMSLDFMKETYIALYRKGDAQVTAFLSKQPSRDAAAKTLTSYESHMKKYGKVVEKRETDGYTLITADMGGAFDVVFRKGNLIGGVSMVEDRSTGRKGGTGYTGRSSRQGVRQYIPRIGRQERVCVWIDGNF